MQRLHITSAAAQSLLRIPSACPQSPIFAVQLQEPRDLAKFLQKRGMMVRAVVPPTVPLGTERVRVCLHAGNTVDEVELLVGALQDWCEQHLEQVKDNDRGVVQMRARI